LRPDWSALGSSLSGEVLLPGEPSFEAAYRPKIPRFGAIEPDAVIRCETAADVRETIGFAIRHRLPTAIRSGGHCFAGRSSTDGALIDVSPMRQVSVDAGLAAIGAGARLGDLYDALLTDRVTIPAGCGPTVGIAGLVLGGGLGVLGRRHGLTCDALRSAQVVLADGRIVDCDASREPDLFWALRGGGSEGPGVVTSLRFDTVPAPDLTVFHLTWPFAEAVAVLDAWQAWAPRGPDELAASLLIKVPAEVERPPTVNVFGSLVGDESSLIELLDPLVVGADSEPTSATHEPMPFRDAKRRLVEIGEAVAGEAEGAAAGDPYSKSEYFPRRLPPEAVSALIEHLGSDRVAGQARELDFTPWGGAYNRVPASATAFVHRDQLFLLKHGAEVGADAGSTERDAARRWLAASWELVHHWGSGGAYPNFPDPELDDPERAYLGSNLARVVRVRRRYDPDGVFAARSPSPARG
jgi:FAD/FMN-containing dehydrogenase